MGRPDLQPESLRGKVCLMRAATTRSVPVRFPGLATAVILGLVSATFAADPLPGTEPLVMDQPLDVVMVDGIDRFCLREIAASAAKRAQYWKPDYTSHEAYRKSVEPNRERLKTILGVVDARVATRGLELLTTVDQPSSIVAENDTYTVHRVRWAVLEGVTGEGLFLKPKKPAVARVIALPDADQTPEQFVGLVDGVAAGSRIPAWFANRGCEVLVPTLISRDDEFSGNPDVAMTNQPHREFVYRQAFEMGRHVIGYEVQRVLAGADALEASGKLPLPTLVAGYGEGGLVALFASAVSDRFAATFVSGYFGPREGVWEEPIYRNVWAQLTEFGDAEIARLIAPRRLVIEACAQPKVEGPPAVKPGRRGGAAPGKIVTPTADAVKGEFEKVKPVFEQLKAGDQLALVVSGDGSGPSWSAAMATAATKAGLGQEAPTAPALMKQQLPDAKDRQQRQFQELVDFTQRLLRRSARERDKFWSKGDRTNVDTWTKSAQFYRDHVYDEMIGRLPAAEVSPRPRLRQVIDDPAFTGYEVVLDVYPDVIAGGILLLPKDLKPGEKRPVVVCQHGLEGVPMDTISKTVDGFQYYKAFTAELASRGFITFAPQNPYRGRDRFRTLQRKSNPLKRSLFSYIIPQHQRILDFLKTHPNVDAKRMGFYGLSYGGKTAVRVPPMLSDYALSICSADFNEWVLKNATVDSGTSYMFTGEYEIFEWNMGHVANYAELSTLMTPRPFMVERGHTDGVAPDEWVAWEFAKVLRHYDFVGLPGMTELEVFNGPHTINGKGTYEFLHRHLNWPKR
jgi:hypothetical protein